MGILLKKKNPYPGTQSIINLFNKHDPKLSGR